MTVTIESKSLFDIEHSCQYFFKTIKRKSLPFFQGIEVESRRFCQGLRIGVDTFCQGLKMGVSLRMEGSLCTETVRQSFNFLGPTFVTHSLPSAN